jgi:hypothetical protein
MDRVDFDCPIDNCSIKEVAEAKENRDLFRKAKTKEEHLTQKYYEN